MAKRKPRLQIHVTNSQKSLRINQKRVLGMLMATFRHERVRDFTLQLVFLDDRQIRKINKRFLKHDYATDVLAFDYRESGHMTDGDSDGEIFVSTETARREAHKRGIPIHHELTRYCVHGLLHLLGYRDTTLAERTHMWNVQETLLEG